MTTSVAESKSSTPKLPPLEHIRARFPALARRHAGKPVAYFDGPGGTQVPREVADAMTDYLFHHNANTGWNYPTSIETNAALAHSRQAFADFMNASPEEISFGNNMTTITFHVARALGRRWERGDEIIVTELDHYGNVSPWRNLEKERGIIIRTAPFDPKTGELIWSEFERLVNNKTKLVAIGAASNALGTMSPVGKAAKMAKAVGALCYVDAVHYAAHGVIDVKEIGCDFLACSPYKFYGPHSGVLFARGDLFAELDVPKVAPAGNAIPERIETGTQNHEAIVGAGAAVTFLESLGTGATRRERLVDAMSALHARGDELVARLWKGLTATDGVTCYGPPPGRPRTPTICYSVAGVPSKEVATRLVHDGIFASNGGFYAQDVIQKLGFTGVGLVRAGSACYTTEEEIDRLIEGTRAIALSARRT